MNHYDEPFPTHVDGVWHDRQIGMGNDSFNFGNFWNRSNFEGQVNNLFWNRRQRVTRKMEQTQIECDICQMEALSRTESPYHHSELWK